MVLGVILLLLIALIALIPTIASTAPARAYVLNKVNQNLHGRLQVDDWSFGWGGNLRVDGVRLFDDAGRQILELPHLAAHVAISNAIRGKYDLGKVVIDGLDFLAVRDPDGTLNFAKLAKSKPAPAVPPIAKQPGEKSKPSPTRVPDIRAELVLQNCRGTIEDKLQGRTARLVSLDGDVNITDINQPITETIKAVIALGDAKPGKLSVEGRTALVKNNVLLSDPADLLHQGEVEQKVSLVDLNLASLAPFLGSGTGVTELSGIGNGELNVHLKPMQNGVVDAKLVLTTLRAGGPALKGDTLAADTLEVTVPATMISLSPGESDVQAARLVTGSRDGKQPLTIRLVQGPQSVSTITCFADATPRSLASFAKSSKPADPGSVRLDTDIDAAHLATSMPNMFKLVKGLQLDSGRVRESLAIDLAADKSQLKNHLQFTEMVGRNTLNKTDVRLQPIDLTVNATSVAGGGPLPDLRDITADLTSAFATAHVSAKDLSALEATVKGTLEAAQKELGQVVDFGTMKMAGAFDLTAHSQLASAADTVPTAAPAADAGLTRLSVKAVLSGITIDRTAPPAGAPAEFSAHAAPQPRRLLNGFDATLTTDAAFLAEAPANMSPLMRLKKANIVLEIPSLAKLNPDQPAAEGDAPLPQTYAAASPVTPPGPTTAPTPAQVTLTGGSATVTVDVSNDGKQLLVAPQINAKDVAFRSDAPDRHAAYTLGPADLTMAMALTPTPVTEHPTADSVSAPPPIQAVLVSKLLAHVAGTEVSLKEPLSISNLANLSTLFPTTAPSTPKPAAPGPADRPASLAAALVAKGDIAPLVRLLEALDAQKPGSKYPYTGNFLIVELVALTADHQQIKGSGDITGFAVHQGEKVTFSEPAIHLGNDVQVAGQATQTLTINNLSVSMQTSKALDFSMHGAVADLAHRRELRNLNATLAYDLEKLWKTIYPMMSPANRESLKDVRMTGQYTQQFTASGSYPAGVPFNIAIRSVQTQGRFMVATFTGKGLEVKEFDFPYIGKDGKFLIAKSDKPNDFPLPAQCNGGQLSIGGAVLDLSEEHPRLTMLPNTYVMRDVAINPTLANSMGSSIGNFLFATADKSGGKMTIIVPRCERFPLDDLYKQQSPRNDGVLQTSVSITDVEIGGGAINKLTGALKSLPIPQLSGISLEALRGSIKDYTIRLEKGVSTHDMTLFLVKEQHTLHLGGTVGLQKMNLNMVLQLPWELFGAREKTLVAAMPNGIEIPVGGSVDQPKFDVQGLVQKSIFQNFQKNPENLIKGLPDLFNPKKEKPKQPQGRNDQPASSPPQSQTQPAAPADDPLGLLQGLLNKDRKDKNKPKQ